MSEEFNKSMIRRIWKEIWREGNLTAVDELIDGNHVLHAYPEDLAFGSGAEGFKRLVGTNRVNLTDAQLIIEDLIAEGDKVVTRYTLRNASSTLTTGIWIDRIQANRVVESWVDWDRLVFFRQLGLIPPPAMKRPVVERREHPSICLSTGPCAMTGVNATTSESALSHTRDISRHPANVIPVPPHGI